MAFKPRSKTQKKMYKKRPFRKGRSTFLVNKALHPIPQRFITKMKYSGNITTSLTNGQYAFQLNSLYDPDYTSTGHQPYGFDTLASLYNRYRVIACGYRINIVSSPASNPLMVTALPANQLITASTCSEIRENPRAKYITQNSGAASVYLSNKVYLPSLVGRSRAQYMADDRYQSAVNTSPQEEALLNIQTWAYNDVPAAGVVVQVVLEYTVEFFDIKQLGQS